MPQVVPFDFEPPASEFAHAHLVYEDDDGGQRVKWPLVGATVFVPAHQFYHSLDEMVAANGGGLTIHGGRGFSLGKYHEFFIEPVPRQFAAYSMGEVEASLGYATPLAAFLFEPRREKWDGTWDDIVSLRIFGAEHGDAEVALINACLRHHEHTGFWPRLIALGVPDWYEEQDEDISNEPTLIATSPMVTNLEPLRFLSAGMAQADDASACVYFYRVIEYYSFFANAAEIGKLRHNPSLSDAEFAKKMLDFVSKDEKAPIFKTTISSLDDSSLNFAKAEGLIASKSPNAFAEALYSFRNSIVHGKYSYGFSLQSGSVLSDDPNAAKWRYLLLKLAKRVMAMHSTVKT